MAYNAHVAYPFGRYRISCVTSRVGMASLCWHGICAESGRSRRHGNSADRHFVREQNGQQLRGLHWDQHHEAPPPAIARDEPRRKPDASTGNGLVQSSLAAWAACSKSRPTFASSPSGKKRLLARRGAPGQAPPLSQHQALFTQVNLNDTRRGWCNARFHSRRSKPWGWPLRSKRRRSPVSCIRRTPLRVLAARMVFSP